ncbi:MAG: ergothioneine biosynthesis protein EgtB, partial [Candidatus Dormibacteraceae bacterium]
MRQLTNLLCQPLVTEDYVIQAMPDVSPPKWHLAHTSWFFETFILAVASPDYRSPHASYAYLFNSYYMTVGERHCRPKRGLLSRPTIEEVYRYRAYVD